MGFFSRLISIFLVSLLVFGAADAQTPLQSLQLRLIQSSDAPPSSTGLRDLVVEVTDGTGAPVSEATITFHLPEEGPSGAFADGTRTAIANSRTLRPGACYWHSLGYGFCHRGCSYHGKQRIQSRRDHCGSKARSVGFRAIACCRGRCHGRSRGCARRLSLWLRPLLLLSRKRNLSRHCQLRRHCPVRQKRH